VILRNCLGALATALAAGNVPFSTDLFTVTLQSGTIYRWTSWDRDLVFGGNTFVSSMQWLSRGRWNVTNTMEVPTLEVTILSTSAAFGGGTLPLQTQLHNGLLDGATLLLQRLFMPNAGDTVTYGTIDIFAGDLGAGQLQGAKAVYKVRGKNSRLSVNVPRNIYQPSCIHTFCDPGCTLSAGANTHSFVVASGSTSSQVNLTVADTFNVPIYGTLTMTSGVNNGQQRTIIDSLFATAMVLARPLIAAPAPGDTLTIFGGCDKTFNTCVNTYGNGVNFRAFPYIPPPATTAPGQ
jgi:uncharacterized phage protein (TIGR02218 family)